MATIQGHYPNVMLLVRQWLADHLDRPVFTALPDGFAANLPCVRVESAPAAGLDGITYNAAVDVDIFAQTIRSAETLVDQITRASFELAGNGNAHGYVDNTGLSFFFSTDYAPDPALIRLTATLNIAVRPQ